jgi:hypothetical protein
MSYQYEDYSTKSGSRYKTYYVTFRVLNGTQTKRIRVDRAYSARSAISQAARDLDARAGVRDGDTLASYSVERVERYDIR